MSQYTTLSKAVALAVPLMFSGWAARAGDIVETAEYVGGFNGFLRMLEAAGMADVLRRDGPFTVFAPTDEAFAQLPQGTVGRLLAEENRERLKAVVQAHIVRDAAIPADSMFDRAVEVANLNGGTLALDGTLAVVALVPRDVLVTEERGQTVVEEKSVATPVPTITVRLAQPGAPQEPVAVHAGQAPKDAAIVVKADIGADNGVIHAINSILLPPELFQSLREAPSG